MKREQFAHASENLRVERPDAAQQLMRANLIEKLHDPHLTPDERYSIISHLRATEPYSDDLPNPYHAGVFQSDEPKPASEFSGAVPYPPRRRNVSWSPETSPVQAQFSDEMSGLLGGHLTPRGLLGDFRGY